MDLNLQTIIVTQPKLVQRWKAPLLLEDRRPKGCMDYTNRITLNLDLLELYKARLTEFNKPRLL